MIPAQVKVIEHVQICTPAVPGDRGGTSTPIVKAPTRSRRSWQLRSASAIAHVINEKYVQGVPLYRQEQELRRLGGRSLAPDVGQLDAGGHGTPPGSGL